MAEEPQEKQESKRFRLGPWIFAIILVGAAIGGYLYWKEAQQWESTDDAQIDGRVYPVSARVSGTVIKVNVQDNQPVEAGAILAELDPRDFQVAVDQARADVAQAEADAAASKTDIPIITTTSNTQLSSANSSVDEAKATLDTAQKQVEAAQAKLNTSNAVVRQAKANAQRATQDLERFRGLVAKEEISRQQFDTANTTVAATQAQVDAAEAQLEEARQAVRVTQNQVAQYQARVARAESDVRAAGIAPQQVSASEARARSATAKVMARRAELERAMLNLEYCVIRAPIAGIASRRSMELGQIVPVGQPLVAIVPLNDIWVTANFKESQLDLIRVGQKATISVDAFGGQTYSGHVESVSAATGARFSLLPPENATGNFVKVVQRVPVKIVFDDGQHPERVLRPGMSVTPKIAVR